VEEGKRKNAVRGKTPPSRPAQPSNVQQGVPSASHIKVRAGHKLLIFFIEKNEKKGYTPPLFWPLQTVRCYKTEQGKNEQGMPEQDDYRNDTTSEQGQRDISVGGGFGLKLGGKKEKGKCAPCLLRFHSDDYETTHGHERHGARRSHSLHHHKISRLMSALSVRGEVKTATLGRKGKRAPIAS